jgi:hypothetical protein
MYLCTELGDKFGIEIMKVKDKAKFYAMYHVRVNPLNVAI